MSINPLSKLHPRRAQYRRYFSRYRARQQRRDPGVLSSGLRRSDQPGWTDYYPEFPGTRIEKVVFAQLIEAGVTFYFGAFWGDMPFTPDKVERYRPDFILPEYRIVIEVFGAYWHGLEGAYERDARRAQMFAAAGYKFYTLWDYEIMSNPFGCLGRIPELVNPAIKTGRVYVADRPFDPTASLVAQRRRAPKVVRTRFSRASRYWHVLSQRSVRMAYPRAVVEQQLFKRFGGFQAEYLKELAAYAADWRKYVKSLGDFFAKHPTASKAYPAYYAYWARWGNWWSRWQRLMEANWNAYYKSLDVYFGKHPTAVDAYLPQYHQWLQWRQAGMRRVW